MTEEILIIEDAERVSEVEALQLDVNKLIEVVRYADSERSLCTKNDPKGFGLITVNAKAARGLREQFCGESWAYDETDNQPGILNEDLSIRIIPCNFDKNAGNHLLTPSNRKEKGAASGKNARCNATGWLPGLEVPVLETEDDVATLVLGIYSEDGEPLRAELSFPVEFEGNKYTAFTKRIILLTGSENLVRSTDDSERGEPTETVEIDVKRKK